MHLENQPCKCRAAGLDFELKTFFCQLSNGTTEAAMTIVINDGGVSNMCFLMVVIEMSRGSIPVSCRGGQRGQFNCTILFHAFRMFAADVNSTADALDSDE